MQLVLATGFGAITIKPADGSFCERDATKQAQLNGRRYASLIPSPPPLDRLRLARVRIAFYRGL